MAYPWPGNLRELRNVLERAVLLQPEGPLAPAALLHLPPAPPAPGPDAPADPAALRPLHLVEQQHIAATFAALGGNLTQTAKALQISLSTLKRKLREAEQNGSK